MARTDQGYFVWSIEVLLSGPAAVKSNWDSQTKHAMCINGEIILAAASYELQKMPHKASARVIDLLN